MNPTLQQNATPVQRRVSESGRNDIRDYRQQTEDIPPLQRISQTTYSLPPALCSLFESHTDSLTLSLSRSPSLLS